MIKFWQEYKKMASENLYWYTEKIVLKSGKSVYLWAMVKQKKWMKLSKW